MANRLRVLVCDDDAGIREQVARLVEELCAALPVPVQVAVFSDGAQLLEHYDETADFAFLDIEMPLMDGLEVARELRRRDSGICIVFMTNHEKYAIRGYEVGAWRYLLKPVRQEDFLRELRPPFQAAAEAIQKSLCVRGTDGIYCVEPGQLLYAETLPNHQVALHLRREVVTANTSIRALETQLDPASFFRCHNSFLVNFQYVARIGAELAIKDGSAVPISRHRRTELLQRFTAYLGGKLC